MKKLQNRDKDIVNEIIKNIALVEIEEVTPETDFSDLGMDSLNLIEVVMEVESEFNICIPDDMVEEIESVNDLYKLVANFL